jgi:hypothetical protein
VKTFKIALASLLALGFISAASAQTIVRITGSTAFRAATYRAIQHSLASGYTYAYVGAAGSTLSSANVAIFKGKLASTGALVNFKASFSGSVGGIGTLVNNLTVGPGGTSFGGGGWLINSTATSTTGVIITGTPSYDPAVTADVTMSDSFQASTRFTTPKLTGGRIVGIVPFVFTKNAAFPTTATNITSTQVQTLLNGNLILSALTGKPADTAKVLAVGRDEDSGTRLQAFADSNYGINSSPKQYELLPVGGTSFTSSTLYPAQTVDGIAEPVGHSGYSSGGTLAKVLNTPTTFTNPHFIGYLGVNDNATVNGGLNSLKFNSVAFSPTAVEGGSYSFWGYEHLLYRSTLTGVAQTAANAVATALFNGDASTSGIVTSAMHVHRNTDGGAILSGGTLPTGP